MAAHFLKGFLDGLGKSHFLVVELVDHVFGVLEQAYELFVFCVELLTDGHFLLLQCH